MIDIRIEGIDGLINSLGGDKINTALSNAISKGLFAIERTAKINTPVDTGVLRNSYETNLEGLIGTLRNYREYAPFVHDGHNQTPGRFIPGLGKRLVARRVAGNPWMDRTVEQEEGNVQEIFAKEIDTLLSLM